MDCLLQQREIGHRPRALRLSLASNESLVRRLVNDKCLESHVPASASAFDDVGKHIICAGEDHRLRLWDAHSGVLVKCFDPGHTETITCTAFFPGSNGCSLISAGPARDIRVTDIERAAVRPISSHGCHVKSILPLSHAVFASGGDDGTIRCFDSRQSHSSNASSSNDYRSLLVDQRSEAVGRGGSRMSILSMSHDPLNQQYIATAGGDALVRVYDVRMMRLPGSPGFRGHSRSSPPSWCYCLAPSHLRSSPRESRSHYINSIAYNHNGQMLLAGYSGDSIYSFNVRQHSCSYEQLYEQQQQQQEDGLPQYVPPWVGAAGRRQARGRRAMLGGGWAGQPSDARSASLQRHQVAPSTARPTAFAQPESNQATGSPAMPSVRPSRHLAAAAGPPGARVTAAETAAGSAAAGTSAVLVGDVASSLLGAGQPLPSSATAAAAAAAAEAATATEGRASGHQSSRRGRGDDRDGEGRAAGVAAAAADVSVGRAINNRLLQRLQQALVQGLGDGAAAGDDDMEVTISAEVHLVGPGGTVLHSTTLPLHSTTASARHRRQAAASHEPDNRQAAPSHGLARQQRPPEEQLLFLGGPISPERQSIRDQHTALLMQAARQQMQTQGGSLGPLNMLSQPAAHEPRQRLSMASALPAGGPAQGTTDISGPVMADDEDSEDEAAQPARKRLRHHQAATSSPERRSGNHQGTMLAAVTTAGNGLRGSSGARQPPAATVAAAGDDDEQPVSQSPATLFSLEEVLGMPAVAGAAAQADVTAVPSAVGGDGVPNTASALAPELQSRLHAGQHGAATLAQAAPDALPQAATPAPDRWSRLPPDLTRRTRSASTATSLSGGRNAASVGPVRGSNRLQQGEATRTSPYRLRVLSAAPSAAADPPLAAAADGIAGPPAGSSAGDVSGQPLRAAAVVQDQQDEQQACAASAASPAETQATAADRMPATAGAEDSSHFTGALGGARLLAHGASLFGLLPMANLPSTVRGFMPSGQQQRQQQQQLRPHSGGSGNGNRSGKSTAVQEADGVAGRGGAGAAGGGAAAAAAVAAPNPASGSFGIAQESQAGPRSRVIRLAASPPSALHMLGNPGAAAAVTAQQQQQARSLNHGTQPGSVMMRAAVREEFRQALDTPRQHRAHSLLQQLRDSQQRLEARLAVHEAHFQQVQEQRQQQQQHQHHQQQQSTAADEETGDQVADLPASLDGMGGFFSAMMNMAAAAAVSPPESATPGFMSARPARESAGPVQSQQATAQHEGSGGTAAAMLRAELLLPHLGREHCVRQHQQQQQCEQPLVPQASQQPHSTTASGHQQHQQQLPTHKRRKQRHQQHQGQADDGSDAAYLAALAAGAQREARSQGQVRQPAEEASDRAAADAPADDTLAHTTQGPRVRQLLLDVHGATQLLAAPAAPANPAPAVAGQQSSQCAAAAGVVVHEGEHPEAAAGASPAQGELPQPASPIMSDNTEEFEDWLEGFDVDVDWAESGLEPAVAADKGFTCCFGSHGNTLSTKDVCWMGGRSEYVITGSDNGRLIVWEAATGQVVSVLRGGSKAVRRVKVNPAHQLMVASCGAESVVRLWSPVAEEPLSQEQTTERLAAGSGATDASDARAMAGSLLGMLAHLGERLMGGLFGGLAEADAPGAGGGPGSPRAGGGGRQGRGRGSLFTGGHSGVDDDEDEDDGLDDRGEGEAGED